MKFGKTLKQQIEETLLEWRDKFLCYKELKKLVRLISLKESCEAEGKFVKMLNDEVDKFNAFFVEMEEDFVIRHKELKQRIERVKERLDPNERQHSETHYIQEMADIRKHIVNFHGEMVLLINYSNINYTGLAKILKKYDKRTGRLLRLPFIQKVLEQPFFTTDLVSKLVKELEITIDALFSTTVEEAGKVGRRSPEERSTYMTTTIVGEAIRRNTVAALFTMHEIRRGSSTYSHFSLPPLTLPDCELIQSMQLNSPIPIL